MPDHWDVAPQDKSVGWWRGGFGSQEVLAWALSDGPCPWMLLLSLVSQPHGSMGNGGPQPAARGLSEEENPGTFSLSATCLEARSP